MVAGELVWKITGDDSGLKKKADNVGGIFKKLAGVAAAYGITKFFSDSVKAASDAQETAQKFGNVFTKIGAKANATAKNLAKNYNVTTTAAKEMLGSTGNVLQAFGFSQEAALDYSRQLAELGADLTSFTNYAGGAEEATRILTKVILGERDALQALDLKITEDQLKRTAAAHGLVYKELTQQQKAELTIQELYRQSDKALGDVAKSSNSYAYVTRALDNRQRDLKESVGNEILPALTDLKKAFLESSEDGGLLYNAMIFIGKAVGKVVQGLTVLVNALNLISNAVSQNITDIGLFNDAAKETGNQAKGYKLLAIAQGNVGVAVLLLKKEAESGDKSSQKFLESLQKRGEESQKAANKTEAAYNSLKIAANKFNGTLKETNVSGVSGFKAVSSSAAVAGDNIKKAKTEAQKWNDLDFRGKAVQISEGFQSVTDSIISMLQAIDSFYQASANKATERLEQQREQALEQAGVAEETEVEKAERELEQAKEKGDKELIQEKQIAVKRAKINAEYDKKQAEIDYNASLRSWELQKAIAKIQLVQAPLAAYTSALNSGLGIFTIPFAAIQAGLAAAAAGIQYAAVAEAKPTKPKFAEGGIVPGNLTSGDRVSIQANSGEMILNEEQQANLFNLANKNSEPQSMVIHNYINIDGEMFWSGITNASRRGDVKISDRAITKF